MSESTAPRRLALSGLYADHHQWLYNWLRKRLGNAWDAADLAHDTFLRVYSSNRALEMPEPRAFLTHVAKGLVVDFWRHRSVEQAYAESVAALPADTAPSPESRALILEALYCIDRMLDAMPGRVRGVFLMSQLDGLTYAQIAAATGLSVRTVNRHMQQAYLACLTAIDP
ncbi:MULTISPECIES: sigma-70 family RNA polymerase sigma factor [Achromobacter]|uniref:Sigma-70 family RNA polymerase sigma factor n=1 Tax=Achromobacter spanius TaxID=217203 RepID=A0ABY8GLD2_9BURK|nr:MULTISPECIES: sigma-70 family RNA polymerase sigma factor [Achromobacter]WAI85181.1 sigma-70 family RNA polymerase sigma factor [Achromobacter spanius]WEX95263.1 sigma-70 family RNA polymerase sigma factor [Achromobacter sp. SS2-2022]WFP05567.1 sigma-70 family RNA polymerase sigma factor [Achromobacter spanius]